MATIIKGPRKGEVVKIVSMEDEFAYLGDGSKIRLGTLQTTLTEKIKIVAKYKDDKSIFGIHYDLKWFAETGRFKKNHWARL
jgi:hypothetical protein